jgi:hypothetical protein
MWCKSLVIVVTLALCGANHALALTNLVQNPSFETVSTQTVNGFAGIVEVPTSWTQTGSNGCAFQALQAGQTTQTGADFTIGTNASLPTDGVRVLISDQGPANTSCQIYQDVALPAASTSTLTLDAGFVFSNNASPGSNASVAVTTTGGVLIATVYSRTDVQGTDPLATRPSVDLSAHPGQTVRIIGTVNEHGSNWAGLQIDNVTLFAAPAATATAVATLNEWMLALLAGLLLIAGIVTVRQHRR